MNKNQFSGNECVLLVPEDRIDKDELSEKDLSKIIIEAEVMKRCPDCQRIIIINDQASKVQYYERAE